MNITGAVLKEQGITFAIVVVKPHVLDSTIHSQEARGIFGKYFPEMPIILMAQDHNGHPTYQGRKDIVAFLANVEYSSIPWKQYTLG